MGFQRFCRLGWAAMLACLAVGTSPAAERAPGIGVPEGDTEMTAAIAVARAGLPQFWKTFANPGRGEEGFALKVAISDKGETEFFWLVDVERKDDLILGTINNEPDVVTNVRLGQRYSFTEDKISDWMFMRSGKMVGNETMRPLLKRMTPAEAARFRAMYERP
jgi:uncharacterized protein YegJ (DUF2314 family)